MELLEVSAQRVSHRPFHRGRGNIFKIAEHGTLNYVMRNEADVV